jgi:hypothetical protein
MILYGEADVFAGESFADNVLMENGDRFVTENSIQVIINRSVYGTGLNSMVLGFKTLNSNNFDDLIEHHQVQAIANTIHNDNPMDMFAEANASVNEYHIAYSACSILEDVTINVQGSNTALATASINCNDALVIIEEVEHFGASVIISGATVLANILALQCTTNVLTREERGHWENSDGFLSSNMYLQDNHYYQDYSYEIESNISIHHYRDAVTNLIHPSGTKMFGKYVWSSDIINEFELIIDSYLKYEMLNINTIVGEGNVDTIPLDIVRTTFGSADINGLSNINAIGYRNIYMEGFIDGSANVNSTGYNHIYTLNVIDCSADVNALSYRNVYMEGFINGYSQLSADINVIYSYEADVISTSEVNTSPGSVLYASADIENTIGTSMSVLAEDTVIRYSVSISLAGASIIASSDIIAGFGQGSLNQAPLNTWTLNGHFGTRDAIITEDNITIITEMADILINEEVT